MPPQLNIPSSSPQPPHGPSADGAEIQEQPQKMMPEVRSLRPAGERPEDRPTQRVFSSYQTGAVPTVTQPVAGHEQSHTAVTTTRLVIPTITAEQSVAPQSGDLPAWVYSLIGGVSGFILALTAVAFGMLDGALGITNAREEAVEQERERIVEILQSDRVDIEAYGEFKPETY